MQTKINFILHAAICTAVFLIQLSAANAADQDSAAVQSESPKKDQSPGGTDAPKQAPPRPSQILDISYKYYPGIGAEESAASLTSFISSISATNNLRYERKSPDSVGIPKHLYRISEMFSVKQQSFFVMAMGGSSSDTLFHDNESADLFTGGGIRVSGDEDSSLYAGMFYSKEKLFHYKYNFPIPFLSYFFKSDSVSGSIGVPTLVFWKITKELNFNVSYFPAYNIDASLNYRPLPFITLGPAASWRIYKYKLSDETNDDLNLYHEQIQLLFKIQSYVARNAGLYIAGGYSFRERYFHGTSSMDTGIILSEKSSWIIQGGIQGFLY